MKKRMILMLAAVTVFVAVIGTTKYQQIQAAIEQGASFQPPPEAVTTVLAAEISWPRTLNAIGTVTAVQGVTVSADLPGIVERITFESGQTVREGQVLVFLDTAEERAQLESAEARRELALLQLERMRGLREKGVASQAELDLASAEARQAEARVREIGAAIDRKTIRAPFGGIVGIRQVDLGEYLASGDPIVSLQSLDPIYVSFSVPQQEATSLVPGTEVLLEVEGSGGGEVVGRVSALESFIDPSTRNLRVQATFENPDGPLRPGMFVRAEAVLGRPLDVIALPASAISYAPYGDSVFVVEDMEGPGGATYRGVRQQFVELGGARGDLVVVRGGVEPGEEVVTSGVFKLRPGAAVLVDNENRPSSTMAPQPEDS